MFDEDEIIACLKRIEYRLNSDEYESGGIFTIGGPNGTYQVKSPFNTEAEWMFYGADGTSTYNALISGNNSGQNMPSLTGGASYGGAGNAEGNALEGIIVTPQTGFGEFPGIEFWQPLGRGASIYVTISGLSASQSGFIMIAFRRKLERVIPTPPRREAHTHSRVESRRGERTFAAGFEAQYPRDKYIHEEIPESQDTAEIGNVANVSPAQAVLAKMRRGGR